MKGCLYRIKEVSRVDELISEIADNFERAIDKRMN